MEIRSLNLYVKDKVCTKRSGDKLSMCKLNLVVRRKFKITRGVVFLNYFPERIIGGWFRGEKVSLF